MAMNPSNEMMDLGFAPALAKFEKLLARRLRRHDAANEGAVRYITNEDAVRYTFFHALTTTAKGLGPQARRHPTRN